MNLPEPKREAPALGPEALRGWQSRRGAILAQGGRDGSSRDHPVAQGQESTGAGDVAKEGGELTIPCPATTDVLSVPSARPGLHRVESLLLCPCPVLQLWSVQFWAFFLGPFSLSSSLGREHSAPSWCDLPPDFLGGLRFPGSPNQMSRCLTLQAPGPVGCRHNRVCCLSPQRDKDLLVLLTVLPPIPAPVPHSPKPGPAGSAQPVPGNSPELC